MVDEPEQTDPEQEALADVGDVDEDPTLPSVNDDVMASEEQQSSVDEQEDRLSENPTQDDSDDAADEDLAAIARTATTDEEAADTELVEPEPQIEGAEDTPDGPSLTDESGAANLADESELPEEYADENNPDGEAIDELDDDDIHDRLATVEGLVMRPQPEPDALIASDQIRFGVPVSPWTAGATMAVTPCDAHGTATGEGNVNIEAGWTLPTVDGTALTIPVTAIIPFIAVGAKWYVLGPNPFQAYGKVTYDATNHKFLQTTWYEWGMFRTTISDPQLIVDLVDCTGAA